MTVDRSDGRWPLFDGRLPANGHRATAIVFACQPLSVNFFLSSSLVKPTKQHSMQKAFLLLLLCGGFAAQAQPDRWQQHVKYTMDVNMDVNTNRFTGRQKLDYTNNSPDTLDRVFYHLYWNAFQPLSMMDERSRHLGSIDLGGRPDWDDRVRD